MSVLGAGAVWWGTPAWVAVGMALPVVVWGAASFHVGAWRSVRRVELSGELAVSLAVLVGFAWSVASVLAGATDPGRLTLSGGGAVGQQHLGLAVLVVWLGLAGRWLSSHGQSASGSAPGRAVGGPATAGRAVGRRVSSRLRAASVRVPAPGAGAAANGTGAGPATRAGTANEAGAGAATRAGTANEAGAGAANGATGVGLGMGGVPDPGEALLTVGATAVGGHLGAGRDGGSAARLEVGDGGGKGREPVGREPVGRDPVERVVGWFGGMAVVVAVATLGFWLAAGGPPAAGLAAAVAVVVLAAPGPALLASPVVLALVNRRARDVGVALGDGRVPAIARRADTILVRRSGTLTTGQPWLLDVATSRGTSVDRALHLVGSLALKVDHPVARAVVEAAEERCLPLAPVEVLAARPGLGVRGVVHGVIVTAGRERFVTTWTHHRPDEPAMAEELEVARTAAEAAGQIALLVAWDDAVRAVLVVGDPPRPTAADAVAALAGLGLAPVLVSGDSHLATTAMADAVGIGEVASQVLGDETAPIVAALQARGRVVVTLGPGGTPSGPADLVVARPEGDGHHDDSDSDGDSDSGRVDLWTAVDAVRLARAASSLINQNLVLGLAANAALLPLAATGQLQPPVAVVATAVSAVAVAANSCRILRFRSVRPPAHRGGSGPARPARSARSARPAAQRQSAHRPPSARWLGSRVKP